MNILYLTTHLNTGGITSYLLSLSAGLQERGHTVYLASSPGDCERRFSDRGITIIPISLKTKSEASPKVLISFLKLLPLVKKNKIDIIHANTRVTQVLAALLQKFSGVPYISTCHGFFKNRFTRRIFPCWGERVIAISEQVKGHLMRDFKVREDRICLVHNGIDLKRFNIDSVVSVNNAKEKLGLGVGPVVGIVARLSEVKGHIYLVEAMKEVITSVSDAHLLIAGEGKSEGRIKDLIKELGIEKNVFFIPRVDDTREVLAAIDVFVMPSLHEGLGLGLMEAMACGLAVVGSKVGGIKSLIQDQVNGMLVEPRDSKALADAIVMLLRDSGKRKAFGLKAKESIVKNFSSIDMVLKTERVYKECALKKEL